MPTISEETTINLDIEVDEVGFNDLEEINIDNLLGNEEFAELY